MKLHTENLLIEAAKLVNNASAEFCILEAFRRYKNDYDDLARNWALKSIVHSAGINHPLYTQNC